MKTAPIIAKLKADVALFAGRVAGAAELARAENTPELAVPHAFVVPLGDAAGEDQLLGSANLQELTEDVRVVVCLAAGDAYGQTGVEQLHDLRADLYAALLQWAWADGYSAFHYVAGSLIDLDPARLWWAFDFAATTVTDLTEE